MLWLATLPWLQHDLEQLPAEHHRHVVDVLSLQMQHVRTLNSIDAQGENGQAQWLDTTSLFLCLEAVLQHEACILFNSVK